MVGLVGWLRGLDMYVYCRVGRKRCRDSRRDPGVEMGLDWTLGAMLWPWTDYPWTPRQEVYKDRTSAKPFPSPTVDVHQQLDRDI